MVYFLQFFHILSYKLYAKVKICLFLCLDSTSFSLLGLVIGLIAFTVAVALIGVGTYMYIVKKKKKRDGENFNITAQNYLLLYI